jgi:N-acetylneuraminate lyase
VQGLYVGGSSGECIYHSVAERKAVLEAVMEEVGGKLTVIAHVACNNTADSRTLAAHAESLGVDAIASIPPIYFHLPEDAIARNTGTTFPTPHRTRISSSTTFPSWPVWR